MGDRANVYVADQGNPATGVFFYTQFEGHKLPCIVQHGLKKAAVADRLGDTPYLARFIFLEMAACLSPKSLGISVTYTDGEIFVVDDAARRVGVAKSPFPMPRPKVWWNYEDFFELVEPDCTWSVLEAGPIARQ